MKLVSALVAGTFALTVSSAAFAQAAGPQVPNPSNPRPAFPVATDGTPLPTYYSGYNYGGMQSGRSVAIDGPLGVVGSVVGTGVGLAGTAVNTGVGFVDPAAEGIR
jgi:hypothetical protein